MRAAVVTGVILWLLIFALLWAFVWVKINQFAEAGSGLPPEAQQAFVATLTVMRVALWASIPVQFLLLWTLFRRYRE